MENWLTAIRNENNITQSECAKRANIAQPYYCQIENGERRPSVETAKAIALVLGFDWTRFYEDERSENSGNKQKNPANQEH